MISGEWQKVMQKIVTWPCGVCGRGYYVHLLRSFNGLFSRTTWVSRHQKSRTMLLNQSGFTGARDSEWQWHQLGDMQIWTSLKTDNHASTPPLSFLQAGCHAVL